MASAVPSRENGKQVVGIDHTDPLSISSERPANAEPVLSNISQLEETSRQRRDEQRTQLEKADQFSKNSGFQRAKSLYVHANSEASKTIAQQNPTDQHQASLWLKPGEISKLEGKVGDAPDDIKILLASAPICSSKTSINDWFYRVETTTKGYLHIVFTSPVDEKNGNVWYRLRFHSKTNETLEACAQNWIEEKHYGVRKDTERYPNETAENAHRIDGNSSYIRIGKLESKHANLVREIGKWSKTAKAILPNCSIADQHLELVTDLVLQGGLLRVVGGGEPEYWISKPLYKLLTALKIKEQRLDQLGRGNGDPGNAEKMHLPEIDPALDAAIADIAGKILPACHHEFVPSRAGFRLIAVMNEVNGGDEKTLANYAAKRFRVRPVVDKFNKTLRRLILETRDIDRVIHCLEALGDVDAPKAGGYAVQLLNTREDSFARGKLFQFLSNLFQEATSNITDNVYQLAQSSVEWHKRIQHNTAHAVTTLLKDCQTDSIRIGEAFGSARDILKKLAAPAGITGEKLDEALDPFTQEGLRQWLAKSESKDGAAPRSPLRSPWLIGAGSTAAVAILLLALKYGKGPAPRPAKPLETGNDTALKAEDPGQNSEMRLDMESLTISSPKNPTDPKERLGPGMPPPSLLGLLNGLCPLPSELREEIESSNLSETVGDDPHFQEWLAAEGSSIAVILRDLYHPYSAPDSIPASLESTYNLEPHSAHLADGMAAAAIQHRRQLAEDATAILASLVQHEDPRAVEDAVQALVYISDSAPKVKVIIGDKDTGSNGKSALQVLQTVIEQGNLSPTARLQAAICLGNNAIGNSKVVEALIEGHEQNREIRESSKKALLTLARTEPCPATLNQHAQSTVFKNSPRSALWTLAEKGRVLASQGELFSRESLSNWETAAQIPIASLEKPAANYPVPLINASSSRTEKASYRLLFVPDETDLEEPNGALSVPGRLVSEPLWLPVKSENPDPSLPKTTQKWTPSQSNHELEYTFRLSDKNFERWLLEEFSSREDLKELQKLAGSAKRLPISWARIDFCIDGKDGVESWDTAVVEDSNLLKKTDLSVSFNLSEEQMKELLSVKANQRVFFRITFANTEQTGPEYLTTVEVPADWYADVLERESSAHFALKEEIPERFADLARQAWDLGDANARLQILTNILGNLAKKHVSIPQDATGRKKLWETIDSTLKVDLSSPARDPYFSSALEDSHNLVKVRQAPETANAQENTDGVRAAFLRWKLEQRTKNILVLQREQQSAMERLNNLHSQLGLPAINVNGLSLDTLKKVYQEYFESAENQVGIGTLAGIGLGQSSDTPYLRVKAAQERYSSEKGYVKMLGNEQLLFARLARRFAADGEIRQRLEELDCTQARETADVDAVRFFDSSAVEDLVDEVSKELHHFQKYGLNAEEAESYADVKFFPLILLQARRIVMDHYRYELLGECKGRYPEGITFEDIYREAVKKALLAIDQEENEACCLVSDAFLYHADRARVELQEMQERYKRADLDPGEILDKIESEPAKRMEAAHKLYASPEGQQKLLARRYIVCQLISGELGRLANGEARSIVQRDDIPEDVLVTADIEGTGEFDVFAPDGATKLLSEVAVDLRHYVERGSDLNKADFYADVKTLPMIVNQMRRLLINHYRYYIWATQHRQYLPDQTYEGIDRLAAQAMLKGIANARNGSDQQTLLTLNTISNELRYRAESDLLRLRFLQARSSESFTSNQNP